MARTNELTSEKLPEKMELKKHVAVIHSSNKLSLLQRKIANALLFNAYPNLQYQDEHVIHIAKLCEIIGYDSNDHKTIKCSLVGLLSTVLQWNLVDGDRLDKDGAWNASSIIADAGINGAICTYSYSNKMRKLLYRPNLYGRLDMNVQAKFKSGYGLALYENCNRFQDIGQTPWFDIEKFRQLMGVETGKYKQFKDFKTRVLDKAVQEVNQYSSFHIEPQLRRQNRQVTAIQFVIKKSREETPLLEKADKSGLPERMMRDFGLSARQVDNAFQKYDEKYIVEKMDLIESSPSYVNGRIKNVARYLMKALSEDYQPAKRPVSKKVEPKVQKKPATKAIDLDELTALIRYQDKLIMKRFQALKDTEKSKLLKDFEKILPGVYRSVYGREGLGNVLLQDKLCEYLRVKQHDVVQTLPTAAEWKKAKA